ncbi:hypothetical protein [Petroclostridium sp. X23]|uniref:hypothetical protein n=1 Tax=Petroclostridium sp. X23 TaxID=3045146 RepID=UPI0024ADA45F|nr:hypothetical protein [Petroclostridium sp. X23]WHH61796.1 hypothetical protein QKW49_22305 [Petroclostridium sp. X23]
MKNILEKEILSALGCTEPIALAYAAAAAYKAVEGNIQSVECEASGNNARSKLWRISGCKRRQAYKSCNS